MNSPHFSPRNSAPDLGDRFIKGPVLIIAGLAMHAGLLLISRIASRPTDIWMAIGQGIVLVTYTLVATLFILVGLRAITGPRSWLDRWMQRTKRTLWFAMVAFSVLVVAVLLFL